MLIAFKYKYNVYFGTYWCILSGNEGKRAGLTHQSRIKWEQPNMPTYQKVLNIITLLLVSYGCYQLMMMFHHIQSLILG